MLQETVRGSGKAVAELKALGLHPKSSSRRPLDGPGRVYLGGGCASEAACGAVSAGGGWMQESMLHAPQVTDDDMGPATWLAASAGAAAVLRKQGYDGMRADTRHRPPVPWTMQMAMPPMSPPSTHYMEREEEDSAPPNSADIVTTMPRQGHYGSLVSRRTMQEEYRQLPSSSSTAKPLPSVALRHFPRQGVHGLLDPSSAPLQHGTQKRDPSRGHPRAALRVTSQPSSTSSMCGVEAAASSAAPVEPDEEEWDARQRLTGAAGRLVIYEVGELVTQDFLLRGGCGRRVTVTSVLEGGKAACAGIKAGDILASINGWKDFHGKSADEVHASLRAPVMLVFLGFVGKLQAEVRLNYKQKSCGMASQSEVLFGKPETPALLLDEIVFQPHNAPLLLTTRSQSPTNGKAVPQGSHDGDLGAVVNVDGDSVSDGLEGDLIDIDAFLSDAERDAQEVIAVYEIRAFEARKLVSRALLSSHFIPQVPVQSRFHPGQSNSSNLRTSASKRQPPAGLLEAREEKPVCDVEWFIEGCMPMHRPS